MQTFYLNAEYFESKLQENMRYRKHDGLSWLLPISKLISNRLAPGTRLPWTFLITKY